MGLDLFKRFLWMLENGSLEDLKDIRDLHGYEFLRKVDWIFKTLDRHVDDWRDNFDKENL